MAREQKQKRSSIEPQGHDYNIWHTWRQTGYANKKYHTLKEFAMKSILNFYVHGNQMS